MESMQAMLLSFEEKTFFYWLQLHRIVDRNYVSGMRTLPNVSCRRFYIFVVVASSVQCLIYISISSIPFQVFRKLYIFAAILGFVGQCTFGAGLSIFAYHKFGDVQVLVRNILV